MKDQFDHRGECIASLLRSIEQVGGRIPLDELMRMPLAELITVLAQNGIRFTVIPRVEEDLP